MLPHHDPDGFRKRSHALSQNKSQLRGFPRERPARLPFYSNAGAAVAKPTSVPSPGQATHLGRKSRLFLRLEVRSSSSCRWKRTLFSRGKLGASLIRVRLPSRSKKLKIIIKSRSVSCRSPQPPASHAATLKTTPKERPEFARKSKAFCGWNVGIKVGGVRRSEAQTPARRLLRSGSASPSPGALRPLARGASNRGSRYKEARWWEEGGGEPVGFPSQFAALSGSLFFGVPLRCTLVGERSFL